MATINSTIPKESILLDGDLMQTNPISDHAPSAEDFKRGNGIALKIFKQMDDEGMPFEIVVPKEWIDREMLSKKPDGGRQKSKIFRSNNPHNN